MPIWSRSRTALRYWPAETFGSAAGLFASVASGVFVSTLSLAALFSLLNTDESLPLRGYSYNKKLSRFGFLEGEPRPSGFEAVLYFRESRSFRLSFRLSGLFHPVEATRGGADKPNRIVRA